MLYLVMALYDGTALYTDTLYTELSVQSIVGIKCIGALYADNNKFI